MEDFRQGGTTDRLIILVKLSVQYSRYWPLCDGLAL